MNVHRIRALAAGAGALVVSVGWGAASALGPSESVERMLARVLRAPEVQSRVMITRSDPFGGPDEHTLGRVWLLPGRGLRFRTEGANREDVALDRTQGTFLVYRPAENVVYRAEWERAPARLRQIIDDPTKLLEKDLSAVAERRTVGGVSRSGYRLRRAALGDSLPSVSLWIAADPATGLLRWVSAAGDEDSVLVEFRGMSVLAKANPRDLAPPLARGAKTQPLDPRSLLPGGESR